MNGKKPTILVLLPNIGNHLPATISGILAVAAERGWEVFPIAHVQSLSGHFRFDRAPAGGSLQDLLSMLKPDGIIVALNVVNIRELRASLRAAGLDPRTPTVLLSEGSSLVDENVVCASGDSESFASLALRELLCSGFTNYSFVPDIENRGWSRVRQSAFERLVHTTGRVFVPPPNLTSSPTSGTLFEQLQPWLSALPKPCGIFAANDISGESVLRCCAKLKIAVPDQVAVVSVDDITYICDHTSPTLTSVHRDLEGEGRAAAAALAEWLANPRSRPKSRVCPAISIVRRQSTRFSARRDHRVAKAEEWIRIHACEHATPAIVAREMGVSRPQADRLFRAVSGRSILAEIHDARIERAKIALRSGTPPIVVASETGYSSLSDFRRVFRRVTGQSLGAWTKAIRSVHAW